MWAAVQPSDKLDCPMDYIELLSNLAGNGCSVFHYLSIQMSLLATIGLYHKGLALEVPDTKEAEEEDEQEEADCASFTSHDTASESAD